VGFGKKLPENVVELEWLKGWGEKVRKKKFPDSGYGACTLSPKTETT
jgi:hypothetical protein